MNNKYVKIARVLRKNQTPQEVKLWACVKARRFKNLKFRRQHPIGIYIVDFCCEKKRLVIELDGSHHATEPQLLKDILRDRYLKNKGYQILRVWSSEVDHNLDGVFEKIHELTN